MCRKFECREDIHYKTQTGTSCEKCNSKALRLHGNRTRVLWITFFFWITCFGGLHFSFGLHVFEPASSGLHVLLSSFARSLRESIFLLFFSHSPRSQFVARSVRKPQPNTFTYRPRKRG